MIIKENLKVIKELIISCQCDRCKENFIPDNMDKNLFSEQYMTDDLPGGLLIQTTMGYNSMKDGQKIEMYLCDDCLFDLQKSFK